MRYIDTRSISSVPNVLEKYYHLHHQRSRSFLHHKIGLSALLDSRKKKRTLSKAQRKRIANERRHKFISNIIIYHENIHEQNRTSKLEREKGRILSNIIKRPRSKSLLELQRDERNRKTQINDKLLRARDRVYARRVRSRSRWNELLESQTSK